MGIMGAMRETEGIKVGAQGGQRMGLKKKKEKRMGKIKMNEVGLRGREDPQDRQQGEPS
jgi:hypothetical protein